MISSLLMMSILAAAPLNRGINMDHIFDPYNDSKDPHSSEEYAQIAKALQPSEFKAIRAAGFDFVRMNLGLRPFQDPAPSYKIREEGFILLDRALEALEENGLSVILDCHQIPVPPVAKSKSERKAFINFWKTLASRYRGRPESVLYGVLNEPRVEKAESWRDITLEWIGAVRALDPSRTLVVSGGGWGSLDDLMAQGSLPDPNLIYDFHFYLPFAFTHQGADWGDPVQMILKDIHYPLRPVEMEAPLKLAKEKGWETWPMDDYPETPGIEALEARLKPVVDWAAQHHVRLLCGEFGAIRKAPQEDRARWLSDMRGLFEKHRISWAVWGFHSGFDIFDDKARPIAPLLKALIP